MSNSSLLPDGSLKSDGSALDDGTIFGSNSTLGVSSSSSSSLSLETLGIYFGLSLGLQLLLIVLFSLLRPKNNVIYARRSKYIDANRQPPKLAPGLFSWIKPVLFANHDTLALQLGLDAAVFLNFIQFCAHIFTILSVILPLVLIPINYTSYIKQLAPNRPKEKDDEFDFSQLSIIAVGKDTEQLWAHAVMCWVVSCVFYYAGYRLFRRIIALRQNLFASREYAEQIHPRVIMVTQLPKEYRSDRGLHRWLGEHGVWHPSVVAVCNRKIGNLPKLVEEHEYAIRQLESLLAKYYQNPEKMPKKRPTRRVNGYYGEKVDAIDYYAHQIDELETQIYATRRKFREFSPSSVGFICYPSISEAHQAMRILHNRMNSIKRLTKLKKIPQVTLGTPPDDIIWTNITLRLPERTSRQLSGTLVFIGLLLFGMVAVSWIATLTDIPKIMANWAFTQKLFNRFNKFFRLVSASISPLLMALFFMGLPRLLRMISRYKGAYTNGQVRKAVLKKFFTFLFINQLTVLMTAFIIAIAIDISKGRWKALFQSVEPGFKRMVQAMVKASSTWITFITLRGVGLSIELVQLLALIRIFSRQRLLHPTPRELKEFTQPPHFPFEVMYGNSIFLMLIGILFSVISPIVLLFALLNFAVALMVFRYQLMYVYATKIERDGALWPTVYNQCIAAITCFQLLMVVVLNIKNAPVQACIVIPLPLITVVLWSFGKSHLMPQFKYTRTPTTPVEQPGSRDLNTAFTHPAFSGPLLRVMVSRSIQAASQRLWRSSDQQVKEDPYSDKRKLIETSSVVSMERGDSGANSADAISTWSRPTMASTIINDPTATVNEAKSLRMRKPSVSTSSTSSSSSSSSDKVETLADLPLRRNINSEGCWNQDWDVVSEVDVELNMDDESEFTDNDNNTTNNNYLRRATLATATLAASITTTNPHSIVVVPSNAHRSNTTVNRGRYASPPIELQPMRQPPSSAK
ncbi:hypothetical protein BDF19DRAFT_417598 [Syncephalis fuscata]|nr:hypothetical protein BDF19DRAFT_417598 [Syncephalis fuscata]